MVLQLLALRYQENLKMPRFVLAAPTREDKVAPCKCYQAIVSLWVQNLGLQARPTRPVWETSLKKKVRSA